MAVSSLLDLVSAGYSQKSLRSTSSKLQNTVAHLASGKRIAQAFEDIASMSIATGLQSQVSSLRQASLNVAQADSMLQVADGGMGQIGEILQRMQALTVQANSGALSKSAREGLNTEFQGLAQEIDRLSGNTNFNNVKLLDGSLSTNAALNANGAGATKAEGSLNFTANLGAGQTVVINGVTMTAGVNFAVGGSAAQTVTNLANALNASTNTNLNGATYTANGTSLFIESDTAGEAGNQFTINQAASTGGASFFVSGNNLSGAGVFSLTGGTGLGGNNTSVSGTVGDNLVTGINQQSAKSTLSFNNASDIQAGNTIQIDDGEGGFVTFTFTAGAPASNTDIQIGSNLQETLQNAVATMDAYTGADDYGIRQLNFTRNGNSIEISNKDTGNALDVTGAALNINLGTTGGSISNAALNNGSNAGVDVSGVSNTAFVGNIQGFSATFNSADNINASITVGGETYTANITDTTPAANSTVRFTSANGGFFDVQLAAGNGQAVNSQAGADSFANRLDAAFSNLSFSQNREVTNFDASGPFNGASMEIKSNDFSNMKIDDIRVTAATGANSAQVEFEINGETFRSSSLLGDSIGAGESVTFTSTTNPNRNITFRNGVNDIDLSSTAGANQFEDNLKDALGVNNPGGATFQTGAGTDDVNEFIIGDTSTDSLFGGAKPDLLSLDSAASANKIIGNAINTLTSYRANVGAYQQSLNFAAANLESAIQNQEAARATLQDTDFASESSLYALLQVQQQASIATLAQTNRMSGNMLKLLGGA